MQIERKSFILGTMPYADVQSAARMVTKLCHTMPGLLFLPNVSPHDNVIDFTFSNIPGIKLQDKKYLIKTDSKIFLNSIQDIEKTYETPDIENLSNYASDAVFLENYLKIIKKFNSKNACFEILGPISISQILINKNKNEGDGLMLSQKVYRRFFIEITCIKALWMIKQIKAACPNTVPIVILNEPYLNRVGEFRRKDETLTNQIITGMLSKVIDKLKDGMALVGVHSASKCDWTIPINAGVDIISFDAYNNPNNLSVIPEQVTEFIAKGGKINWALVPTLSEFQLKSVTVDNLNKRFSNVVKTLAAFGVPAKDVYASALISTHENLGHLPIMFAEKAILLADQLSKKILLKS